MANEIQLNGSRFSWNNISLKCKRKEGYTWKFVRDSTLDISTNSISISSTVFRLKDNYKNLSAGTYTKNLMVD